MTYETARTEICSGDLVAWSVRKVRNLSDLPGMIVRIFTASEYKHVGIAWVIGGRVFVVEAVSPCVRIYPLSAQVPFYHVNMSVEWADSLESYLLSQVGVDYSLMDDIRAYFGKPAADNKGVQCAELCNDFYEAAGIHLGDAYTPSEVVEACLQQNRQITPTLRLVAQPLGKA